MNLFFFFCKSWQKLCMEENSFLGLEFWGRILVLLRGRILIWVLLLLLLLLLLCFSSFVCLGVLCFVLSFFKVLGSFLGFWVLYFQVFSVSKLPRFLDLVIDCVCVVCFCLFVCVSWFFFSGGRGRDKELWLWRLRRRMSFWEERGKKVLIPIFFLQQIGWEEEDRFRKREKQLSWAHIQGKLAIWCYLEKRITVVWRGRVVSSGQFHDFKNNNGWYSSLQASSFSWTAFWHWSWQCSSW